MTSSKIRILLVEDNSLQYRALKRFFEKEGYEIIQHPEKGIVNNYEDAISLLHSERPNLAVLDIVLDQSDPSKPNGLDIGDYIYKHFWMPVIFLTDHPNVENTFRASDIEAKGFIVKCEKPILDRQLWSALQLLRRPMEKAAVLKTESGIFNAYEWTSSNVNGVEKSYYNKVIRWNELKYISTADKQNKQVKNNIFLHLSDGKSNDKTYIHHSTLQKIAEELPPFIVRINKTQIFNVKFITDRGKSEYVYRSGDMRLELTDPYREEALRAIRLFVSLPS